MKDLENKQAEKLLLQYVFDAPKKLVFDAFSDPDALNEWWGPVETRNTVISLDFRPGGIFHFSMARDGSISYGRFLYTRIEPHDLLAFTNAFADEHANPIPPPFDESFPTEIHYTLRFSEKNDKTMITLTAEPVDASARQHVAFKALFNSMEEGFGATFKQLELIMKKQKLGQ